MTDSISRSVMTAVSPFFIVGDLGRSISFYCDRLGFDLVYLAPEEDPGFGILRRDGVQFMIKYIADDVPPLPNSLRHPWARWDAFVHVPDPDALAAEFISRNVNLRTPLADTDDGLRGFEVADPDGYVIFFGRPG